MALIGTIIPLLAVLYFAWSFAVVQEKKGLVAIAEHALDRTDKTLLEAAQTLKILTQLKLTPCSKPHIQEIRRLNVNNASIEEIGYFKNGFLACTSWGITEEKVAEVAADRIQSNGVGFSINNQPIITNGNPMVVLSYQHYNILINPQRFVDIIMPGNISLTLMGEDKRIIGTINSPSAEVMASPTSKLDTKNLIIVLKKPGFIVIVNEPRALLESKLGQQLLLLLPFGLIMAIVIVGLIVWFLRRRLSPLGELAIAVEKKEFVVFYQPIVNLKTQVCVGAEALVKWRRPGGELIQPDLFIPLAEQSGLILPITDQIIDAVIEQMRDLLSADKSLHIAINLSVADIESGRILQVIEKAIAFTGISRHQIWLEATERGFMKVEEARKTIFKARKLGYIVAIDDFGTGYSSLSTLQNFPLNILKIDKTFIDRIGSEAVITSVIPHIINMAQTLELDIVAEGIEQSLQADYLMERGVKYGQGWLYAKALPAKDFIKFYKNNKASY